MSVADDSTRHAHRRLRAVSIRSLGTCLVLVAASVAATAQRPAVIQELDVPVAGNMLIADVTIGEHSYPFMIDTGSSFCIFDERLRHLLRVRDRPLWDGIKGRNLPVTCFDAPPMRLRNLEIRPTAAVCIPLRDRFAPHGCDVYGVLGFGCFAERIIEIDFDVGKLRVLARPRKGAGRPVSLKWSRKGDVFDGPYAIAEIVGGGEEQFLVDTGACGLRAGSLRKACFDRALAQGSARPDGPAQATNLGVFGYTPVRTARIAQFALGPFCHSGLLMDDAPCSKLGLSYLSRYIVTFDFPNSTMYLREGRQFARRDAYDLSGIGILAADNKVIVAIVDRDSPAERAGLRLWDELVCVDNLLSTEATILDLRQALARPGKPRVVFVRDGARRETMLDLAEPAPHTAARPMAASIGGAAKWEK